MYQTKLLSNWKTYLCFFGSISGLSCLNTFILNYLGCLSVEDYLTHFMWDFHIIKLLWQQMFLWSFVFFFIFQKVTCAKSHTFLTWKFGNPGSILIFFVIVRHTELDRVSAQLRLSCLIQQGFSWRIWYFNQRLNLRSC